MLGDRHERLRDALSDSDVFGALTDEELDGLIGYGLPTVHPKNHVIFQKGDPGDSLMVVLSGRVKISTLSPDGKEAVLNFIGSGQSFGEIAMFDGKPRSADATAIETSEMFVLRRADVQNFLVGHPEIAFRIIGILCERVRRTSDKLEAAVTLNMTPRIARALVELSRTYGRPCADGLLIDLKLSQRELGGYIGLARENVNRQLTAWRHDGLVSTDDGRILIHDLKVLQRIADQG
jgi:CRP/FNR family cyclic AMP-dependent transcriptional regulator